MGRLPFILIFLMAAMSLVACRVSLSSPQPAPAADLVTFIDSLRASGASVELGEAVDQPFFSAPGKTIILNGEDVQVFQYLGVATAKTQAALVALDGNTIGASKPTWMESPHFFRQGKLLVLYIGSNDQVLKMLTTVLGRQFAGN